MVTSASGTGLALRQATAAPPAILSPVCAPHAQHPCRNGRKKKRGEGIQQFSMIAARAAYQLASQIHSIPRSHFRQAVVDRVRAVKASPGGSSRPALITASSGRAGPGSTAGRERATIPVHVVVLRGPLPPGQQLVLVGGDLLLGEWDPTRGARLVANAAGSAHLLEVNLPVDKPIAAKLVLLQDGVPIHWESGNDRMLYLAPPLPAGGPTQGSPPGYLLLCEFENTGSTVTMLWPPAPIPRPPDTAVLQLTLSGRCLPPTSISSGAVDELVPVLTGSSSELGEWDPTRGIRLRPDPTAPGSWVARVPMRLNRAVASKLVLCSAPALAAAAAGAPPPDGGTSSDVAIKWELGPDRILGPSTADKILLCNWDWGVPSHGPVEMDLPPPSPSSTAVASITAAARPGRETLSPPPHVPPPTPAAAAAVAKQQQQSDLAAARKMVEKAAQRGRPMTLAEFEQSSFLPPPLPLPLAATSPPVEAAPASPPPAPSEAASRIQEVFATMHDRQNEATVEKEMRAAEAARAFEEAKERRRRTGSPSRASSPPRTTSPPRSESPSSSLARSSSLFGGLQIPPPQSPFLDVVEVLDSFEPDEEDVQVLYNCGRVTSMTTEAAAGVSTQPGPRKTTSLNWRELLEEETQQGPQRQQGAAVVGLRDVEEVVMNEEEENFRAGWDFLEESAWRGALPSQSVPRAQSPARSQYAATSAQSDLLSSLEEEHMLAMEAARLAAQTAQRQMEAQLAARAAAEEARISEYEAQMEALRQQVEITQAEAAANQLSLGTLQQQLDSSKGREVELTSELWAMQAKLAEAAGSHSTNNQAVNALEESIQEARQHYESALVELQRADAAGSYSLRLLERLEGAYHSALDQYGELEVELAAAKSAQQQSQAMLQAMEEQVATSMQLAGSVEVYEKQVQMLQEQLQLSAAAHDAELSALQGQLRTVEARSQQTEDLYESMLKEMKSALDDALSREQVLHRELSSMQTRAEEFQRQVETAATGMGESVRQEEALRREVARLRRVIEQYKEYLTEHDGELSRSLEREEALDAQLSSLQGVVQQQEEHLKVALARQEELARELDQQRRAAGEYEAQLAEQQQQLREAAETQAAMKERAEAMQQEMERLQNLTDSYNAKLDASRSEVAAAAVREVQLRQGAEVAAGREMELLGRVEKLQSSIAQYKSRLQEQESSLSVAAQREGSLQMSLMEQAGESAALRAELEALGGEYAAAVDTIEQQRGKLEVVAAAQEEVAVMAVQMQTLQVELSAERTRHTEEMAHVQQVLEEATDVDRHRMQAEFEMQKAVLKAEYEVKLTALREALSVVKTALTPGVVTSSAAQPLSPLPQQQQQQRTAYPTRTAVAPSPDAMASAPAPPSIKQPPQQQPQPQQPHFEPPTVVVPAVAASSSKEPVAQRQQQQQQMVAPVQRTPEAQAPPPSQPEQQSTKQQESLPHSNREEQVEVQSYARSPTSRHNGATNNGNSNGNGSRTTVAASGQAETRASSPKASMPDGNTSASTSSSSSSSSSAAASHPSKASRWAAMAAELAMVRGDPAAEANGSSNHLNDLNGKLSNEDNGKGTLSTAATDQKVEGGSGSHGNAAPVAPRRTRIPSNWRESL